MVYITTKTKGEARRIAQILVKERLAACVNIFPIESIYRWSSSTKTSAGKWKKIKKEREFGMFVKTKKNLAEKIINRVKELHSYKIPCIISLPIEKGNKDFLKWIKKETK